MARVVPRTSIPPLALLSLLLIQVGCASVLSREIVRAPNAGKTAEQLGDLDEQDLYEQYVTHQLRVNVGPPAASLSCWVVEAWSVDVDAHLRRADDNDPDLVEKLYARLDQGLDFERSSFVCFSGREIDFLLDDKPGAKPNPHRHLQLAVVTRGLCAGAKPEPPKGTIFLLHGIGDRKENVPYRLWARILAQAGYRAVLVDLRGHGRSTGNYLTYGVTESGDLRQLLDALDDQGLIVGPVGVWGISYGAAVAIQWAATDSRVKAVVAFEPFCTLRDAVRDFAPVVLGPFTFLAVPGVVSAVTQAAAHQAGFKADHASPLSAIRRTDAPVLLVHGTDDHHLYPDHSRRLHEAAPGHSDLYLVKGANHLTLWIHDLPTVREKVTRWLDRQLGPPTTRPVLLPIAGGGGFVQRRG
jgi:pimeloyl-ACP methyl ester carboxylesterase